MILPENEKNKERNVKHDERDIDLYMIAIKRLLIDSYWTKSWTETTIISCALAFTLDNMDTFNAQYEEEDFKGDIK
tara:strand:+ start:1048 stop:1275 length:228 start_codon:yes stop_codon:yes gene_type:complete